MSSSTPQDPFQHSDPDPHIPIYRTILALCGDQWDTQFALRRAMRLLDREQLLALFDEVADYVEASGDDAHRELLLERFGDVNRDRL